MMELDEILSALREMDRMVDLLKDLLQSREDWVDHRKRHSELRLAVADFIAEELKKKGKFGEEGAD